MRQSRDPSGTVRAYVDSDRRPIFGGHTGGIGCTGITMAGRGT